MKTPSTLDLTNTQETLHLATDLQKFIAENKLSMTIQGKAFVNVEGWQYAGARLGILPVVEELFSIGTDDEIKYQAKVTLLQLRTEGTATPQTVGTGYAVCSNKENGKRFYQEFAIASMAQTRAIGKAYRNLLAWIIRAAGYEPTPAEEMDYELNRPTGATQQAAVSSTPEGSVPSGAIASKPASAKQKSDILLLLSHRAVTAEEKERTVRQINTIDAVRAQQVIVNLKKAIRERQAAQVAQSPAA
ncbi:hypothetical protein SAMN05421823_110197 [Catalinimonas alkaloidigena]|uniref:Uncharacterized protein n=1 Tax=Catalinimonas alkaloidigena TaxID=1075417 RepID=A0A1G9QJT2_9BACT|nr:hypothetical protein [Catalinimonas alkaloidigena]SDM11248.1 hypothetical protein SAMN05421823_110197 [Catalinimonas alkaloidigena]